MAANAWTVIQDDGYDTLISECDGYPLESYTRDGGFVAQVMLRCPWDLRFSILDDIIGNQRGYPRLDANSRVFATGGSSVGNGATGKVIGGLTRYDEALLTLNYGFQQLEIVDTGGAPGAPVITFAESLEPSAEFITLDPKKFKWSGGDRLQPEEAPGKLIVGAEYIQTVYGLTSLPEIVLEPGQCNADPIYAKLLEKTFDSETLLYHNSSPSRNVTFGEINRWQMSSRFGFRPNGWNKFWRAKSQTWERIVMDDDGAPYDNYPLGDLSTIIY